MLLLYVEGVITKLLPHETVSVHGYLSSSAKKGTEYHKFGFILKIQTWH